MIRFPLSPSCLGTELSLPRPVCQSTLSLSCFPNFQDNLLAGGCEPEPGSACDRCVDSQPAGLSGLSTPGTHRSAEPSICDAISLSSHTGELAGGVYFISRLLRTGNALARAPLPSSNLGLGRLLKREAKDSAVHRSRLRELTSPRPRHRFRSGCPSLGLPARLPAPAPPPTLAVTEARRGDLTVQHGGGGRLGPRVEAAAAAPGPCAKHLPPPPPPPSSLPGQGRGQVRGVGFRGGPAGWRGGFPPAEEGVSRPPSRPPGAAHAVGETGRTVLLRRGSPELVGTLRGCSNLSSVPRRWAASGRARPGCLPACGAGTHSPLLHILVFTQMASLGEPGSVWGAALGKVNSFLEEGSVCRSRRTIMDELC